MKVSRNHSMAMPINPFSIFAVASIPFMLPSAWISSENRTVYNSVQQVDNPKWLPPISMTGNGLSITIRVPKIIKNKIAAASVQTLKGYLIKNAELWASEKFDDVDLEEYRAPETWMTAETNAAGGMDLLTGSITPNPNAGHYTPFGNVKLPWYLPLITGYIGVQNYMIGGLVESFTSDYDNRSLIDTWKISLQGINISALRKDAPNGEPPELVDDVGNIESGPLQIGGSHGTFVLPGAVA